MTGVEHIVIPRSPAEKLQKWKKAALAYSLMMVRKRILLLLAALLPLILSNPSDTVQIIAAASLEVVTAAVLITAALISRNANLWAFEGSLLETQRGVFVRRSCTIGSDTVSSVTVTRTPLTALCGAVRMDISCICAGKKPDAVLYIRRAQSRALTAKLMPIKANYRYIPKTGVLLLMSVSDSNLFLGLLLLAPIVFGLGRSFGSNLSLQLYLGISDISASLLPFIPPLSAALAGLLLLGWVVHFVHNCFVYGGFMAAGGSNRTATARGIISSRLTCVSIDCVSSLDIKQTLLSRLLKVQNTSISVFGHARPGEIPLMPSACRETESIIAGLVPRFSHEEGTMRVNVASRISWWLPYTLSALAAGFLWFRLYLGNELLLPLFTAFALPVIIVLMWRSIIGAVGASCAFVEINARYVRMRSVYGLSIHDRRILLGKAGTVRLKQSPFQKARGLCSLYIKAAGAASGLVCRGLPLERAMELAQRIK